MKTLLTLFVLFFSSSASAGIISGIRCYYQGSRDLTLNSFGHPYGGLLFLLILPIMIFLFYKIEDIIGNKNKKLYLFLKKKENLLTVFGFVIIILFLYLAYRFGCLI